MKNEVKPIRKATEMLAEMEQRETGREDGLERGRAEQPVRTEVLPQQVQDAPAPLPKHAAISMAGEMYVPTTTGREDGAGPRHDTVRGIATDPQQASNAPAPLEMAYHEMIKLSQSVRECSDTLNRMEGDDSIDLFAKTQLREEGRQRILALRSANK